MRVTHRVSRIGLVLSLSVILSGCAASLHQVSLEERRAIQEKKKAIVLLRLTATLNEKEMSPLADERNLIPIRFGLANLDIGEPVRKFTTTSSELLFSLSSEGAYGGWAALAIDPGNYYFRLLPTTETWYRVTGPLMPAIAFRFTVSPDAPAIYIGSLRLNCTSPDLSTAVGWMTGVTSCWPDPSVIDERQEAAMVVLKSEKLAAPLTALMQPYGSPLAPGELTTLSPVGFLTSVPKADLQSPRWMSHAIERGVSYGLAPSILLGALAMGGGGAGPGAGAVAALAVLWAPVGATLGAVSGFIGGKWSESSYEPCLKNLRNSVVEFDPEAVTTLKLNTALQNWGVKFIEIDLGEENAPRRSAEVPLGSILHSQIRRIALRHCEADPGSLCTEVAVRARLIEAKTNKVLFYSYGGNPPSQPYELVAGSEWTSGREIDAYCGTGGIETLHADISRALDSIVYQVAQDLGLRLE